jgi:hypothetical protein
MRYRADVLFDGLGWVSRGVLPLRRNLEADSHRYSSLMVLHYAEFYNEPSANLAMLHGILGMRR